MKKAINISIIALLISSYCAAQNMDDAFRYNKRELTGTSRSLGMANAFGALGGDLSAISINPAGIAVYQSSEFAFTPSISVNKVSAKFGRFNSKDDDYAFPFNQIGGVTTYKKLREKNTGIVSTHFGFTYNRTADFNSKTNMMLSEGVRDFYDQSGTVVHANTLLSNIIEEANGYNNKDMSDRAYWFFRSGLIRPVLADLDAEDNTEYYSEYDFLDKNSGTYYDRNVNGISQKYLIENSGHSGEYGFTFGANVNKIFLLGASLNFQTFKSEQKHIYREVNTNSFDPAFNDDLDYYDLYTKINEDGFGVNGKFGLILNLYPIRFGASFHTPTLYNINKEEYDGLESYFLNLERLHEKSDYIFDYSYNYRTPYRAQGSLAIVFGKIGLLSIDYEMTDHSSSKFISNDGYDESFRNLNREIKDGFKITHDIKAGVEFKPVPYIAIRGGAAYYNSPFKDEYVAVKMDKWMATAGIGIRSKNFFFDVAYAQTFFEDSYNINANPEFSSHPLLDPLYFTGIELENKNHQASFTFGWKF